MKRLAVSFLMIFLLTISAVYASDFTISTDKTTDYPFYATHTDYITVTINNPLQEDWFTVTALGVPTDWVTAEQSIVKIPAMSSGMVRLVVSPSKDARPNIYKYFLKVTRLSTGSVQQEELLINVVQVTSAIVKDLSLSCRSCMGSVNVSGTVINVGSKPLTLSLAFNYGDRQNGFDVGTLAVDGERDFDKALDLEGMSPGTYSVDVSLIDNERHSQVRGEHVV